MYPVNSSKSTIPMAHKSQSLLWPYLKIISGDMYSRVPARVDDKSSGFSKDLLNPKSVILMCPSNPTKMFSGFMSLYLI